MATHGTIGHEPNPQLVQFACYITVKLRLTPKHLWPKTFADLTKDTTHDLDEIREECWKRLK